MLEIILFLTPWLCYAGAMTSVVYRKPWCGCGCGQLLPDDRVGKGLKYVQDTHEKASNRPPRVHMQVLRLQALFKLGGRCACCGESQREFLCLDHVRDDGADQRRQHNVGRKMYRAILTCPSEASRYQVLCFNCNYGKKLGLCPHRWGHALRPRDRAIFPRYWATL